MPDESDAEKFMADKKWCGEEKEKKNRTVCIAQLQSIFNIVFSPHALLGK